MWQDGWQEQCGYNVIPPCHLELHPLAVWHSPRWLRLQCYQQASRAAAESIRQDSYVFPWASDARRLRCIYAWFQPFREGAHLTVISSFLFYSLLCHCTQWCTCWLQPACYVLNTKLSSIVLAQLSVPYFHWGWFASGNRTTASNGCHFWAVANRRPTWATRSPEAAVVHIHHHPSAWKLILLSCVCLVTLVGVCCLYPRTYVTVAVARDGQQLTVGFSPRTSQEVHRVDKWSSN